MISRLTLLLMVVLLVAVTTGASADIISASTFETGLDEWFLEGWSADSLATWEQIGVAERVADIGNPGYAIRSIGYGDTDDNQVCMREGTEIYSTIYTNGYHDIQISFDYRVNSIGTAHAGAGAGTRCAVDHNLVDDQLTVYVSHDLGSSWLEVEWLQRPELEAYLGSYTTRVIDLSPISCVNDGGSWGFGVIVKFRWQFNSETDSADIDNIIISGTPGSGPVDVTPPGSTSGISVARTIASGELRHTLTWTNPEDIDFTGTEIRYSTTGYPTSWTDGELLADVPGRPGQTGTAVHTGLIEEATYYYAAFAHDCVPNYSPTAGTGKNPPPPVTNFVVTPGNGQNALTWTNATPDDITGARIVVKEGDYPIGPTDGTLLVDQAGSPGAPGSYLHTGLTNGVTYYYAAISYDASNSFSASRATGCGIPFQNSRLLISASDFTFDEDGWELSAWPAGDFSPCYIAWASDVGNPDGGIVTKGAGMTDSGDRSTREFGQISKSFSTVGYQDVQVSYDIWVNDLGRRIWTGFGSGSPGAVLDHNDIMDQLTVEYSTTGGSTWAELEWINVFMLLDNYQYEFRTRKVQLPAGAANNSDLRLRLRWQFNAGEASEREDVGALDNIVVTGTARVVTAPPSAVTGLAADARDGAIELSWTNPLDADFAGVMIRVSTAGFPASEMDGTAVADLPGAPGAFQTHLHSGLVNGQTYYYSVFPYNAGRYFGSAANISSAPVNINPPGPVTNFAAISGNSWVTLSWSNPTDSDFAGTMIRVSTAGYPADPTEGTLVADRTNTPGSQDLYIAMGLTNLVEYFFSAFAYDTASNFAAPATTSVVPNAYCLQEPFTYPDGYLNGNGGWYGSATDQIAVENGTVRITGAAEGYHADIDLSCLGGPSGELLVQVQAKTGLDLTGSFMWSLYIDDPDGVNLAYWYGKGSNCRGRIGGTVTGEHTLTGPNNGWDDLKINLKPATGQKTAEFFLNGTSIGTLTIAANAGDSVGRIRLESRPNPAGAGDYIFLDNLLVGGSESDAVGPISNFTATGGNSQIALSWLNPAYSSFAGTMIRVSTTDYPAGPTDGTLLVDKAGTPGAADGYVHTGLSTGVPYFYSAFAHDGVPTYSAAATASANASGEYCFVDFFAYSDGALNGRGGWSGTAAGEIGVENQTVKILGGGSSANADRTVNCPIAGETWVHADIKPGEGDAFMWALWVDDPAGLNLARWYGYGTSACGRIGGGMQLTANPTLAAGWNKIQIKLTAATKSAEFFLNGLSLGVLDYSETGAADTIGRVRLQRLLNVNAEGHYVYLDNLIVGGPLVETVAPVAGFSAVGGDSLVALSWTNPADTSFTGTTIRYSTTGYPAGPTDGTLLVDKAAAPGSSDSFVHVGAVNGTTYYYSAFAHDDGPVYATAATASATPLAPISILEAKGVADDQARTLSGKVVTAVFPGFFYIQEPDSTPKKYHGIRVVSSESVSVGWGVTALGVMKGAGAERYLDATGYALSTSVLGPALPKPVGIGSIPLGGGALGVYAPGVAGALGPNNLGLLVRVWGKVTQRDTTGLEYFYVDDGAGLKDGTKTAGVDNIGVRVLADPTAYATGSYVLINGISSCFDAAGLRRQILPRSGAIQIVP